MMATVYISTPSNKKGNPASLTKMVTTINQPMNLSNDFITIQK